MEQFGEMNKYFKDDKILSENEDPNIIKVTNKNNQISDKSVYKLSTRSSLQGQSPSSQQFICQIQTLKNSQKDVQLQKPIHSDEKQINQILDDQRFIPQRLQSKKTINQKFCFQNVQNPSNQFNFECKPSVSSSGSNILNELLTPDLSSCNLQNQKLTNSIFTNINENRLNSNVNNQLNNDQNIRNSEFLKQKKEILKKSEFKYNQLLLAQIHEENQTVNENASRNSNHIKIMRFNSEIQSQKQSLSRDEQIVQNIYDQEEDGQSQKFFNIPNDNDTKILRKKQRISQQPFKSLSKLQNIEKTQKFEIRQRQEPYLLPINPQKILAAPNVNKNFFAPQFDWIGDESIDEFLESKQIKNIKESKLALILKDTIYISKTNGFKSQKQFFQQSIQQPLIKIDFNVNRSFESNQLSPLVSSLSFDRSGNALVAGCSDSLVSIFDTVQGRRIRDMNCHKSLVTDVAWNRAQCAPYIIATGSLDKSIILHDIRQKFSVIQVLKGTHKGFITRLSWNKNQTETLMKESDQNQINLASCGFNHKNGELAVWNLRDILSSKQNTDSYFERKQQPFFFDSLSHFSQIKAIQWNPIQNNLLVTGGSTKEDSVIRLYDIQNICKKTQENNGISKKYHSDVVHSISCISPITSLSFRKTEITKTENKKKQLSQELISTHSYPDCQIKLWQIDQMTEKQTLSSKNINQNGQKQIKYWFTKVKEWQNPHDSEPIMNSLLSPNSSILCSLGEDETLRFWKMFESFHHIEAIQNKNTQHNIYENMQSNLSASAFRH